MAFICQNSVVSCWSLWPCRPGLQYNLLPQKRCLPQSQSCWSVLLSSIHLPWNGTRPGVSIGQAWFVEKGWRTPFHASSHHLPGDWHSMGMPGIYRTSIPSLRSGKLAVYPLRHWHKERPVEFRFKKQRLRTFLLRKPAKTTSANHPLWWQKSSWYWYPLMVLVDSLICLLLSTFSVIKARIDDECSPMISPVMN